MGRLRGTASGGKKGSGPMIAFLFIFLSSILALISERKYILLPHNQLLQYSLNQGKMPCLSHFTITFRKQFKKF